MTRAPGERIWRRARFRFGPGLGPDGARSPVGRGARRVALVALAGSLALLSGCGNRYTWKPVQAPSAGVVTEGIASWYGPGYDGKRTSSGEVFDQDALTAAHPTWAFGTRVRVTLLSTGRSVVVRINDRFPEFKKRAIDLSRGAARAIGLIGPGTGRVRMEIVE